MATRTIKMPPARTTARITLGNNDTHLLMQLDPTQVYVEQKNADLVLTQTNGARVVLQDFFVPSEHPKPSLIFGDAEVPGDELLRRLGQDRMPEAGPVPSELLESHGHYEMSLSQLMGGIDSLGGLDLPWKSGAQFSDPLMHSQLAFKDDSASVTPTANRIPSIPSYAYDLTEDAPINVAQGNVLLNVVPGDGDGVFAWKETGTATNFGSIIKKADGSFGYTLNNSLVEVQRLSVGDTLQESFSYTYTDSNGDVAKGVLTITIHGANDAPVAVADFGTVREDGPVLSATLPFPSDIDQHDTYSYTAQNSTAGTYGNLHVSADGSYTYTLNNSLLAVQQLSVGDSLTETFTYTVQDNHGGSSTTTLTITIEGTNDKPTVAAATGSVTEDGPVLSAVLPTPADVDQHDTLSFVAQSSTAGSFGTLTLAADGSYTYTLNNSLAAVQKLSVGDTLTETFNYTVQDNHGGTATNTLTITINGSNDNPTAAAATGSVTEDGPVLSAALPTPADVDQHDTLSFVAQSSTAGSFGTLTLAADGSYTYTLDNSLAAVQKLSVGDTLTETFNYTVQDNHGGTATNTLTITINGSNDNPTAAAATGSVTEDGPVLSAVLPTPADVDQHDTLSFVAQSSTAGSFGTLTLAADGSYTYTLDNSLAAVQKLSVGDTLTETFNYTVQDNHGGTATNTLTITINGSNDNPTAAAATGSVTEDGPVLSAVLPIPADVDQHDTLSFVAQSSTAGSFGTLTLAADGSYTYTLDNSLAAVQKLSVGDTLTEIFNYTVQDNHGGTATNTLTITINGSNDNPTAAAATGSVTEDGPALSANLPTPTDVDQHDTFTYTTQTNTAGTYGTLNVAADGSYTYTLNNSLAAVQQLGIGESLTEVFNYTVADNHGGSSNSTITITINGANDNPTIAASTNSVKEDTILSATGTIPVPADVDSHDTVSIVPQTNVATSYGTFSLAADGTYTYTLNNSLSAVQSLSVGDKLNDVITYTVVDNHGATGTNTLTISINGTNDLPTVGPTAVSVSEDTAIVGTGPLATPQDIDAHDTLNFVAQTNVAGTYGTLKILADGTYTYTLNNSMGAVQGLTTGETLTDSFSYQVQDGRGGSALNTLTVTINGTNDAPAVQAVTNNTLVEDSVSVATGTVPFPLDPDNVADGKGTDVVTMVPQTNTQGLYGTLTLLSNGNYTYTLNNSLAAVQALGKGETMTDVFNYSAVDNHNLMGTNTITLTITGVNDAPTIAAASGAVTEDTAITLTSTLPAPVDVDAHDTFSYLAKTGDVGRYGTLVLATNGTYTYTLNNSMGAVQGLTNGETLTDTFQYTVKDNNGAVATNVLTITINGTNDLPIATPNSNNVTEDSKLTTSGIVSATDPDNTADGIASNTLTFTPMVNQATTYGTINMSSTGAYTYTLNNSLGAVQGLTTGQSIVDVINFTVSDGKGGTSTSKINITINGTNDAPVTPSAADSVTEDIKTSVTGKVSATDPDNTADGIVSDTLHYTPITNAQSTYGTFSLDANGNYTYVLNNSTKFIQLLNDGDTRQEVFNYTATDDHGGTTTGTFTITINGLSNDPATPVPLPPDLSVQEDLKLTGSSNLNTANNPSLVYTPQTSVQGTYGVFNLNADGTYSYTLNNTLNSVQGLGAGESLRDYFAYTVNDGTGPVQKTVIVEINGNNDPLVASPQTASVTEDGQLSATGSMLPVAEPDNTIDGIVSDKITAIAQTKVGTYGTLTLQPSGNYTYVLNNASAAVQGLGAGETGQDVFNVTLSDGTSTSTTTITINVNGTNDRPIDSTGYQFITAGTQSSINGRLPVGTDVDIHDVLTYGPATRTGVYGRLTINPDGTTVYTLDNTLGNSTALGAGKTYTEVFGYTVSDGHGGSYNETLLVQITGTNDAPSVGNATAQVTEDTALTATGTLPAPTDPDTGDAPHFVVQNNVAGQYGSLILSAAGSYTYTVNNASSAVQALGVGETLTDTLTYTVTDDKGGTSTGQLVVTIKGTNDAPTVGATSASVVEDSQTSVSSTLTTPNDVDIHDVLAFTPKTATGTYGTFTLQSDGSYTYALNNAALNVQSLGKGEQTTDSFTYTVNDGHGASGTNTLTVTITGTNDAPQAGVVTNVVGPTEDALQNVVTGNLTVPTDIDAHDTVTFISMSGAQGTYGTLTVQANGSYAYTLDNSLAAVQALNAGDTVVETFTIHAVDGQGGDTPTTLNIQIHGTDEPVMMMAMFSFFDPFPPQDDGGAALMSVQNFTDTPSATADIAEDTTTVSGALSPPADAGSTAHVLAQNATTGHYGSLDVHTDGTYTYTLDNANASVQALGVGESTTDTFTYTVDDGQGGTTDHTLAITINGVNDPPTVAASAGSINEGSVNLAGTLSTPHDVDTHDSPVFVAQNATTGHYGSLDVHTDGTYTYTLDNANASVQGLTTGESLTDNFTYTVNDGHGGTASNTLALTINGTDNVGVSLLNGAAQENFNMDALNSLNVSVTQTNTSTTQSTPPLDALVSSDPNSTMDGLLASVDSTTSTSGSTGTSPDSTNTPTPPPTPPTIDPMTAISPAELDTTNLQESLQQEIIKNANG